VCDEIIAITIATDSATDLLFIAQLSLNRMLS
jgi:hypothetical protein